MARILLIAFMLLSFLPAGAFAEKRVALVIGNSNYGLAPLSNPKNDADDVAAALQRLQFSVMKLNDLTVREFDWYKLCVDVPMPAPTKPGEQPRPQKPEEMKKVNVCLTQIDVRDASTFFLVAKLAVRQVHGQEKPQVLAMLPLGVSISPGFSVQTGNGNSLELAMTTCDQAGCYGEATVDKSFLSRLRDAAPISFGGTDELGGVFRLDAPSKGFGAALEGKPMPIEKYNADQRKIAEVIRERLAKIREQQSR